LLLQSSIVSNAASVHKILQYEIAGTVHS